MGMGSPAQQKLAKKFFDPFFNSKDDAELRLWLQEQDADELEQFLNWFNFSSRRDRETLGRQELKKLRNPSSKLGLLIGEGRRLMRGGQPVETHSNFEFWINKVAKWLENDLNKAVLSAKWCGLPYSELVTGSGYRNDQVAWAQFNSVMSVRLRWLGDIDLSPNSKQSDAPIMSTAQPKKVFIVHGHDEGARESIARFIQNFGLEPVILHERVNKGRTIITKFYEEAADVGFAVVLMTPDDHGGKAGADTKPRARQNVVLELGFFLGALGPDKVSALIKGDIERPSDLDGVVYISMDHGNWKFDLAKELKSAGLEVDLNKVIGL